MLQSDLRILERDNWTCQLCGVSTPKEFRGTTHPYAPEIDHIIPTSKGGERTPENSRCACRHCNRYKSNREDIPNNVPLPHIDEKAIKHSTQLLKLGGKKGNKIARELHPNFCADGGKIGGKRVRELYPDLAEKRGKIGGKVGGPIGGKLVVKLHPGLAARRSKLGTHKRWHINRNIVNLDCKLCQPV